MSLPAEPIEGDQVAYFEWDLTATPTAPILLPARYTLPPTVPAEPVRHRGRRAYRKPPTREPSALVLASTLVLGLSLGSLGTMAALVIL